MKKKILGILVCLTMLMPALSMTAIANEPPATPTIDGETNGKAGETYEYTFLSTDPDGDDISYYIEWGCGENESTDFYPSGENATASHNYAKGEYTIRVKAVDINQAESDWATLDISMPKGKADSTEIFDRVMIGGVFFRLNRVGDYYHGQTLRLRWYEIAPGDRAGGVCSFPDIVVFKEAIGSFYRVFQFGLGLVTFVVGFAHNFEIY